jgi:MFS family permease
VVVFAGIGTISTAYGLAIIGSTVGQPNFYTYFSLTPQGSPGYNHTTKMIAALNGVNSAGAMLGCGFHIWSSEKFGRKWTMIIGSTILVVGGALCSGAIDLAMFIVGRGIAGMVRPYGSPLGLFLN